VIQTEMTKARVCCHGKENHW